MTDEHDQEALELRHLSHRWKEIDMPTLELSLGTGRMQSLAEVSVRLMFALVLLGAALTFGFALLSFLSAPIFAPAAGVYAAGTLAFARFARRQAKEVRRSSELILRGNPGDVLRARLALLEVEQYAWNSPGARWSEFVIMPIVVLGGAALWWVDVLTFVVPAGITLVFAGFVVYGMYRRPWLEKQHQYVEALLTELE